MEAKTKRDYNQNISVSFTLKDEWYSGDEEDFSKKKEAALWAELHRGLCRTGLVISDASLEDDSRYTDIEQGYHSKMTKIIRVTSEKHPYQPELELPNVLTLEQRNQLMEMADNTILMLQCESETRVPIDEWTRESSLRFANTCIHDNTGIPANELIAYFTYMRSTQKLRFVKWWNFVDPDDNNIKVEWNGFNIYWDGVDTLTLKVGLESKDASYFSLHQENINKLVHWVSSKFLDTGLFTSRAVSCAGSINATVPVSCEAITNDELPTIPEPGEEEE